MLSVFALISCDCFSLSNDYKKWSFIYLVTRFLFNIRRYHYRIYDSFTTAQFMKQLNSRVTHLLREIKER